MINCKSILFLLILLLTGCAVPATSINNLKSSDSEHLSFDVDKNYIGVYKTIIEDGKKCWNLNGMVVEGSVAADKKVANVTFSIKEAGRIPMYYITVDITGGDSLSTSVEIHHRGRDKAALAIKNWVENGSDQC